MYIPETKSLNLYNSLNKNCFLTTEIFQKILTKSRILNLQSEEIKSVILKYDLISCFFVDTNTKEISLINFQISVVESISQFLYELSSHYKTLNFSNLDVQLAILNLLRNAKGLEDLDINQKQNSIDILRQYLGTVNVVDFLEKLYDFVLVDTDILSFAQNLKILSSFLVESVNVEFISRYYYLWLFYKSYINAPKVVFSFVDELSAVGYIQHPTIEQLTEQLEILYASKNDYENEVILNNYLNILFPTNISRKRIEEITRTLSQMYPSMIESLYNLSQLIKLLEEESELTCELYLDGEIINLETKTVSAVKDFDLITDYIEQLHDAPFDFEVLEEFLNFLIDMVIQMDTTYGETNEEENLKDKLETVLSRVFADTCLFYEKFSINIFERVDNLSIFEFTYKLDNLFVDIYTSFSGDFSNVIHNNELNSQEVANGIKSYRLMKINLIEKLISNPEYIKFLITKRKDFYLTIVNRQGKLTYVDTDILDRLKNRLSKIGIEINTSIFSNYESAAQTLENISKNILPIYFAYMAENDGVNEDQTESINLIMSILVKLGLELEIQQYNQLTIRINSAVLNSFIEGYSNSTVIDGEYTLGNLLAFGMQTF